MIIGIIIGFIGAFIVSSLFGWWMIHHPSEFKDAYGHINKGDSK